MIGITLDVLAVGITLDVLAVGKETLASRDVLGVGTILSASLSTV